MKARLLFTVALSAIVASPANAQSSATPSVTPGAAQPTTPSLTQPIETTPPADRPAPPRVDTPGDIVVTGIRASQRAALDIKRNAPVIVDAITATDVGKFPDTNIADALQRVTGVSIDRSNGEGRFITVRGFGPQYNEVLVNGRTMATDNIGREFSFDILSASLISRAEVYKTTEPNLQEGGIGATVNIVTAHPLDAKTGLHFAGNAGGVHDFLSKKTTPDVGAIATWKNADGTFGVEASVNYLQRKSFDDMAQIEGWFQVAPNSNAVAIINGTPQSTGLTPANISYLNAGGTKNLFLPQDFNPRRSIIDQQRVTVNGTVQWKPTDTLLLSLDGIYSHFKVDSDTHYFGAYFTPPYFSDITFDQNGTATHFTRPGTGFAAANPLLAADPRFSNQQNDNVVTPQIRTSQSWQIGGNVKWDATDRLKFEADLSHSEASQNYDYTFVVVGSNPVGATQFSLVPGQMLPTYNSPESTTDPTVLRTHFSTRTDSRYKDRITEARAQGQYDVDGGLLHQIQFGGFFSHREKTDDEFALYGSNYCAYCGYVVPIDQSLVSIYRQDNYLTGSSGSGNLPTTFFTFDPKAVLAYESLPSTLGRRSAGQQTNVPTATFLSTGGYNTIAYPSRGFDVTERVWAGWLNTVWRRSIFSFNLGVRLSWTDTSSSGFAQPLTRIQQNVGDSNLGFSYGALAPVLVRNHYFDALPTANLKVDATRTLVLRLAGSKSITRPTLSDLGTNNNYGGRVTQALSSGGNPLLTPFQSWNIDGSVEWYATRNTSLTGDVFHKIFSGFISNQTVIVPRAGFDQQGNAVTYNFYDTRPRNGNSGTVTGFELAAQHSFDRGILNGAGVGANYTHVTSNQRIVSPGDCTDIEGLSRNSYNVNAFYERFGVHARVAYNRRSGFLAVCQGLQGQPQNTDGYGQLDFNLAYDLTRNFQVYVEGVNVTDSYYYQYSIYKNRFISDENFGSRILFGARAKF